MKKALVGFAIVGLFFVCVCVYECFVKRTGRSFIQYRSAVIFFYE